MVMPDLRAWEQSSFSGKASALGPKLSSFAAEPRAFAGEPSTFSAEPWSRTREQSAFAWLACLIVGRLSEHYWIPNKWVEYP
jgi:hypothetical protein